MATVKFFDTIEDMRASDLQGVYLAEAITRMTGEFDGTKIGLSNAYKGFWDRLRSMFTQCPIKRVALIVCDDKAETKAIEAMLHSKLPMITWEGRKGNSEYTTAKIETILGML